MSLVGINSRLPAVVFLHAFPLSSALWKNQVAFLSNHTRVIALDLPGFGTNPPLPSNESPVSLRSYASYINDSLQKAEISSAVFAGCSFGGYIILELWRSFPQLVAGIAFIDTHAFADSPQTIAGRKAGIETLEKEQNTSTLLPGMRRCFGQSVLNKTHPNAEELLRIGENDVNIASIKGCQFALAAIAARPDSTSTVSTITVPTLVLCGADDVVSPPEWMEDSLFKPLPATTKKSYHLIPECGHLAPWEQPDKVNELLLEYLNSF
ncbi:Alpha/Beta hydrolase protein [Cladochytrium replicatum]|nr:Alpha/Beta hydrolase protein [Cladochytrium replicatum]